MEALQPVKKLTTYNSVPAVEVVCINGHNDKYELVRQALAHNNIDAFEGTHYFKLLTVVYRHLINHTIAVARHKCDGYTGGNWVFNEHGLPHLEHSEDESFEVTGDYRDYTVNGQEFSHAMAILATTDLCNHFYEVNEQVCEFFNYLRHYAFCLLDEAHKAENFNVSVVRNIVD